MDNNGKISREEFSALLSHIPATFRILRRLGCPNDVSSPEDQSASEFNTLTRLDSVSLDVISSFCCGTVLRYGGNCV